MRLSSTTAVDLGASGVELLSVLAFRVGARVPLMASDRGTLDIAVARSALETQRIRLKSYLRPRLLLYSMIPLREACRRRTKWG